MRSDPYFDSSNLNYAMCDGVQSFRVEGCVKNRHVIHSIIRRQLCLGRVDCTC